ncbi:MAG TPA: adenylate/guanylate cyclase domain-containing protein [Acidimicrobiia bacterium]|jgi:class 3 adenylate cyclase/ActR/RegA family two-component response regulator
MTAMDGRITVFLADDNVIVREGVRALLGIEDDLEVVGTAEDYDGLVSGAESAAPQVLVTDIRMPPSFQQEGITAAKLIRKRHPGTGVVVLSQFDDPDYAISLLSDGAAGYAYLLKDRVAEGNQLARAVREVATGGSVLDPKIVEALVQPVTDETGLTTADEELLHQVAEGRPIKAIAASRGTTAAAVADAIEALFLKLSEGASTGTAGALKRLRLLHQAIVDREEQGEQLSRLLPGGLADKLRNEGRRIGETEELVVTVLMADIRGYSSIAESTDPSELAVQLSEHRAEMNRAILDEEGTVMQFVGDAVMACFGAPVELADHAERGVAAAIAMIERQHTLNEKWRGDGRHPFGIGIGLSTGPVAAALLGSEERVEYTLVGDTVNLAQRLQDLARPAGRVVLNETTLRALAAPPDAVDLGAIVVKGRNAPVHAFRIDIVDIDESRGVGA